MDTATKLRKEYQPKDDQGNPIGPPQVFEADTPEELIDKLATAHEHASKKIVELKSQVKPDIANPLPEFKPRELTADERFQLAQQIQNPETFQSAIDKAFEARFGAPPQEVTKILTLNPKAVRDFEDFRTSEEWRDETTDYKVCKENSDAILQYLVQNNARVTKRNLDLAWDDLKQRGLAKLKESQPVVQAPPAEAITPEVTRPRGSTSTGLFAHHSSASGPRTNKSSDAAFALEVQKMPSAEYRRRIVSDPEFRKRVDALGKR